MRSRGGQLQVKISDQQKERRKKIPGRKTPVRKNFMEDKGNSVELMSLAEKVFWNTSIRQVNTRRGIRGIK